MNLQTFNTVGMGEVCAAFLGGLLEQMRPPFEIELDATRRLLAKHIEAARTAWPSFAITPDELASELARRLGTFATLKTLDACRVADVYLAIACCRGDPTALHAFEVEVLRSAVRSSARATRASDAQAAEITAILRTLLLVDEPSRVAACRNFSGRSSLRQYVTIIATRELIRAGKREHKRDNENLEYEALMTTFASSANVELGLLRRRYRDDVEACVREALADLSDTSRATLQLKLVRNWRISQIAALHRVSIATAHRWFNAARDELGDLIRAAVAKRLQIPLPEVDSIVRLVQSCVDIAIEG